MSRLNLIVESLLKDIIEGSMRQTATRHHWRASMGREAVRAVSRCPAPR